jgi:2-polyprenyl-3-methyl-5-hydroxy-6-metoxy-1,4-benzoquinol methylase
MTQQLDYGRYYRKYHSDTPEHIQNMKSFYRRMLCKYISSDKNIRILDVGCGMGFVLVTLKDMGYLNIEGIDTDNGQVEACLKKGIKVTQVDNSIAFLLERQANYDLILSLDVIEHIPHSTQLAFTQAIQTALKPSGRLICTVPNASSGLASRWLYNDWTHHTSFTESSLDFLLFNAGFEEIETYETEFFNRPTLKSLFRVTPLLHWLLFLMVRGFRRLEMIAELGRKQGGEVPLSLNLLATAIKPL